MLDLSGFIKKQTDVVLGTETFTFTELTLADLARFRAHLMKQREEVNAKRRERLLADADKVKGVEPMELLKLTDTAMSEEEIEAQMDTVEGIGYLAYLSLQYAHSGISLDQVMDCITTESLERITAAMFPKEPAGDKPVKKKPRRNRSVK